MSVRTGHGIKYWYKDFSWLLKHLNILIKIIGMSIQSIVELHSNPDFLVDTSIILCQQKFSWFQTKDTKFHAIIPTFKISWDTAVWYVDTGLWLPFVYVLGGKWLYKLLLKEYVVIVFISVMNLGYLKILRSVPNITCLPYFQGKVLLQCCKLNLFN